MPYNSVATRMKISDSSVARHPASRPHVVRLGVRVASPRQYVPPAIILMRKP